MYYIICNTSEIPEHADTTRTSMDGTKAILDDVQFCELGMPVLACTVICQDKALELMETPEWKITE